jgi:hypothetical protein
MSSRARNEETVTVELEPGRVRAEDQMERVDRGDGAMPRRSPASADHRVLRELQRVETADAASKAVIAGVFATRAQAEAAVAALRRSSQTRAHVEARTPMPGRYRLENHGSREIGLAVLTGVAIGALTGGLLGLGLAYAVPTIAATGVAGACLSVLIGAFWGAFYGGVGGMVPKVIARVDEDRWWEIWAVGEQTVVLTHLAGRSGAVRKAMRRAGVCFFLDEIPPAYLTDPASRAA